MRERRLDDSIVAPPLKRRSGAEQSREPRSLHFVAGKEGADVADTEVIDGDLAEDVAEVGGHGQVAPLEPLLRGQPRPLAHDTAAADASADDEHRIPVPMVGPPLP